MAALHHIKSLMWLKVADYETSTESHNNDVITGLYDIIYTTHYLIYFFLMFAGLCNNFNSTPVFE